jgi:Lar family restriction alleviation protein
MDNKLKPCPFCGGHSKLKHISFCQYSVECLECNATTDRYGSVENACIVWNRRHVPAAREAVAEAADESRRRAEADTFGEAVP